MFDFLPSDIWIGWVVMALAGSAFVMGVSKSGFGGSTGILAMPLVANMIPIKQTLGFMLPILFLSDAIAIWHHRRQQSWDHVWWICAGGAIGITGAMGFIFLLDARTGLLNEVVRLLVGVLCIVFVAFQMIRSKAKRLPHIPQTMTAGGICGVFTGFVSTIANAGGPVVAIYMLEQRLGKAKLTGTMVAVFLILNWMKVPGFLYLDVLSLGAVGLSICFLPFVPIGSWVGLWLHKRVPEKPFNMVVYIATVIASISLIYKAISM